MSLLPHQQRVITERNELGEKLEKLSAFLGTPTFDKLDREEQFRLVRQRDAMRAYYGILGERIGPIFDAEVKQAQTMLKDQIVYGTGISLDGQRIDPWSMYPPADLLSIVRKIRACEGEAAALLVLETAIKQREAQPVRELSDDEIDQIANDGCRNAAGGIYATSVYGFARAVLAAGSKG